MLITAQDFAQQSIAQSPFIVRPYIPRAGIVLLYGKKGVGKSPVTWALAQAVATEGALWLGLPVQTHGSVLYIEADTPAPLIHARASRAVTSPHVWWLFTTPHNLCVEPHVHELRQAHSTAKPILVVVNTLRKAHTWDDKVSETCPRVYGAFQDIFPNACILFVHHEKKDPLDPRHQTAEGEEFSGSLAWYNDAQVALRLGRPRGRPPKDGKSPLLLTQTGSQIAKAPPSLRLVLNDDATALENG